MNKKSSGLETEIKTVKDLIATGRVKEAIQKLKSLDVFSEAPQLEVRYANLEAANIKGTITHADYSVELNKITDGILILVNESPKERARRKTKNRDYLFVGIGLLLLLGIAAFGYNQIGSEEVLLKPVEQNGKYGYANETGAIVIPCEFDFAKVFTDSTAEVGMGDFAWKINKKGNCVFDCENIEKYNLAKKAKVDFDRIMKQADEGYGKLKKKVQENKTWIDNEVLLDNKSKTNILKLAQSVESLYQKALAVDSIGVERYEIYRDYWKVIEKKITQAYLPNPEKWYYIKFPGFNRHFLAVDELKSKALLRVRKKPKKESLCRFKFIADKEHKNWYYIKTVNDYFWHSFKRPSHYTDSGVQLERRNNKSTTEIFIISSLDNGRFTLKGEGHDATGGRKQGVLSISQIGGNKRPDGSPIHLWPYLGGGDQQLELVEVD